MIPVMPKHCATCPFRPKGYTQVAPLLTERSLTCTPICHSTGPEHLSKRALHKEPHACRGARNLQLTWMHRLGVIEAPTDEAWAKAWHELCQTSK